MANNARIINRKDFANVMTQMGLNKEEIGQIQSASAEERAQMLGGMTSTSQFAGTVRGRTFNVRMGSDGVEMNGSFDSSINVRGGYNVNMGSVSGLAGWTMGGVSGMRAVGMAQTALSGATSAVGTMADFLPQGKMVKTLTRASNFVKGIKGKNGGANQVGGRGGKEEGGNAVNPSQ